MVTDSLYNSNVEYGSVVTGTGLPSTWFGKSPTLTNISQYLRFSTSSNLQVGMTVTGTQIPRKSAIYTIPNSTEINLATFDGSGFGRDISYVPIVGSRAGPTNPSSDVFFGPPLIRNWTATSIVLWGSFSVPYNTFLRIGPQMYGDQGYIGTIDSGSISTTLYYI
jgi:hypothetical protein